MSSSTHSVVGHVPTFSGPVPVETELAAIDEVRLSIREDFQDKLKYILSVWSIDSKVKKGGEETREKNPLLSWLIAEKGRGNGWLLKAYFPDGYSRGDPERCFWILIIEALMIGSARSDGNAKEALCEAVGISLYTLKIIKSDFPKHMRNISELQLDGQQSHPFIQALFQAFTWKPAISPKTKPKIHPVCAYIQKEKGMTGEGWLSSLLFPNRNVNHLTASCDLQLLFLLRASLNCLPECIDLLSEALGIESKALVNSTSGDIMFVNRETPVVTPESSEAVFFAEATVESNIVGIPTDCVETKANIIQDDAETFCSENSAISVYSDDNDNTTNHQARGIMMSFAQANFESPQIVTEKNSSSGKCSSSRNEINDAKKNSRVQYIRDYLKKGEITLEEIIPLLTDAHVETIIATRGSEEQKEKTTSATIVRLGNRTNGGMIQCLQHKNRKLMVLNVIKAKKAAQDVTKKARKERVDQLCAVLNVLAGEGGDPKVLFDSLCRREQYNMYSFKHQSEEPHVPIPQAAMLMQILGLSQKKMKKLEQFCRAIGVHIFGSGFGKKLSAYVNGVLQGLELTVKLANLRVGTKRKPCVIFWVDNPHRVVEKLVESTHIQGIYESSETFSNKEGIEGVKIGVDKGGANTPLLLMLLNRKRGNGGHSCAMIAQMENAKENHANLRLGIFRDDSPSQSFCNSLLANEYHSITFNFSRFEDTTKKIITSNCNYLRIIDQKGQVPPREVNVELERIEDTSWTKDMCWYGVDDPNFHLSKVPSIQKLIPFNENEHPVLQYQLVKGGDEGHLGYRLFHDGDLVFAKLFPNISPSGCQLMEATAKQVVGILSNDIKMSWQLNGQKESAMQHHPCPICTQPRKEFVSNRDPQGSPLRLGELSCVAMHEVFRSKTAHGTHHTTEQLKRLHLEVFGCVNQPLLDANGKDTAGIMHTPQGLVTHFLNRMKDTARKIDAAHEEAFGPIQKVQQMLKAVLKDCREVVKAYQKFNQKRAKYENRIKNLKEQLELAEENAIGGSSITEREIAKVEQAKEKHAADHNMSYFKMKADGAQFLLDMICTYFKENAGAIGGLASHFVSFGIRVLAGDFRVEHGGQELSHAHNIDFLEQFHEFQKIVRQAYSHESDAQVIDEVYVASKHRQVQLGVTRISRHFEQMLNPNLEESIQPGWMSGTITMYNGQEYTIEFDDGCISSYSIEEVNQFRRVDPESKIFFGETTVQKKPTKGKGRTKTGIVTGFDGEKYIVTFSKMNVEAWTEEQVLNFFKETDDPNHDGSLSSSPAPLHADRLHAKVNELMDKAEPIANGLLIICKILKSQEKLTEEKLHELDDQIRKFRVLWRDFYPPANNSIPALKFHVAFEHTVDIAREWGMTGRMSEEGFESAHPILNALARQTSSIPANSNRVKQFLASFLVFSDPEIADYRETFERLITGPKRGKYNSRTSRTTKRSDSSAEYCDSFHVLEDGFFETAHGLMKLDWKDAYTMCVDGKLPHIWQEAVGRLDGIGLVKMEEAKYT